LRKRQPRQNRSSATDVAQSLTLPRPDSSGRFLGTSGSAWPASFVYDAETLAQVDEGVHGADRAIQPTVLKILREDFR
jgi:hypothetical protein